MTKTWGTLKHSSKRRIEHKKRSGLLLEFKSVLTFYALWPSPWNAFADIAWHEFHEPSEQTPIVCGLPSPPSSAWSGFRFDRLGGGIQRENEEYVKESSLRSTAMGEGEVMNTEVTTTWWPRVVSEKEMKTLNFLLLQTAIPPLFSSVHSLAMSLFVQFHILMLRHSWILSLELRWMRDWDKRVGPESCRSWGKLDATLLDRTVTQPLTKNRDR